MPQNKDLKTNPAFRFNERKKTMHNLLQSQGTGMASNIQPVRFTTGDFSLQFVLCALANE